MPVLPCHRSPSLSSVTWRLGSPAWVCLLALNCCFSCLQLVMPPLEARLLYMFESQCRCVIFPRSTEQVHSYQSLLIHRNHSDFFMAMWSQGAFWATCRAWCVLELSLAYMECLQHPKYWGVALHWQVFMSVKVSRLLSSFPHSKKALGDCFPCLRRTYGSPEQEELT